MMRLAFTRWGLAPAAFWSMSPRELAAALGRGAVPGLGRADFAALMRRFPDLAPEPRHGHRPDVDDRS